MTASGSTTTEIEILSSPPPGGPPRVAAALAVFAAVAFIPWLLTTGSPTQPGPITPTAAAPPEQTAPGSAVSNVGSVDRPAAYARFCQNSPSLCMPAASAPYYTGYIQFCQNSPVLCTAAPKPPDPGYVKFCHNSPVLCTGVRPANPATAGVRSSE
jgi:hypothetical protein